MFATEVMTAEIDCSCNHLYVRLISLNTSKRLQWRYVNDRPNCPVIGEKESKHQTLSQKQRMVEHRLPSNNLEML
jgi:hypothetical protein